MRMSLQQRQALHPFNLLIFVLSLYVIIALLVDAFTDLSGETSRLLHDIDYFICVVFSGPFFFRAGQGAVYALGMDRLDILHSRF